MQCDIYRTHMIAHCIVGTAFESPWRLAHGASAISDEAGYKKHLDWLTGMRKAVRVDVFVVLEVRKVPRRMDLYNNITHKVDAVNEERKWAEHMVSTQGSDARKWNLIRSQPSTFENMTSALRVSSLKLYDSNFLCLETPCLCRNSGTTFAYWEMMSKNSVCLSEIESFEQAHNIRYDFVSRTRTDDAFIPVDVMTRKISNAYRNSSTIHIGQSNNECHGGGDWAAVMPRALARVYFNMSREVSCSFLKNVYMTKCGWAVENYLWQWMLAHPHVKVQTV